MKQLETKNDVMLLLHERLKGRSVRGVTFSVDHTRIRRKDGFWRVSVVPSEEPDRLFATYEELAILESELHEEGYSEIILSLDEPAYKGAA
jgi:hypothetical protein